MKFTLKTLVAPAVALCATAAFAANHARVDVPFSFTAQGQSYPAGSYEVTLDTHNNFVTMANGMDPARQISWSVGPADAAKARAVVTFDQVGAGHALKTIQYGLKVTPDLDPQARHDI